MADIAPNYYYKDKWGIEINSSHIKSLKIKKTKKTKKKNESIDSKQYLGPLVTLQKVNKRFSKKCEVCGEKPEGWRIIARNDREHNFPIIDCYCIKHGIGLLNEKISFIQTTLKDLKKVKIEKKETEPAEWNRWARKDEKNRIIRKFTRNDQGQKIGSKIIGPRPEPENVESPFCEFRGDQTNREVPFYSRYGCQRNTQTYWIDKGQGDLKVDWGMLGPVAEGGERYYYYLTGLYVDSFGIDSDYRNAKKPNTKESVQPLKNSIEEIDALYKKVLEWRNNL